MIARIIRWLSIALIVAVVLYLVLLNREPVTISLGADWSFTAMGAVVFLALFGAGFLMASLGTVLVSFRSFFRERAIALREAAHAQFEDGLLDALDELSCHDLPRAERLLRKIIDRDPTGSIAKLLLVDVLAARGDKEQALALAEELRRMPGARIAPLLKSAELLASYGSKTAALDALTRVLHDRKAPRAALLARDIARSLERWDDAREFHDLAVANGAEVEEGDRAEIELGAARILPESERLRAIQRVVSEHPTFLPGVTALAEEFERRGESEQAATALLNHARLSEEAASFERVGALWERRGEGARAIAALRGGLRIVTDPAQLLSLRHAIASTALRAGLLHDAAVASEELLALLPDQTSREAALVDAALLLRARILATSGQFDELKKFLTKYPERALTSSSHTREALSPEFSTP